MIVYALWHGGASYSAPYADRAAREDVAAFCQRQREIIAELRVTAEQCGHDLWLTRNGHGAGFWDRGNGALGDKLADDARAMGTSDAYIGDDGRIHLT